jgi:PAS domain-containing protein
MDNAILSEAQKHLDRIDYITDLFDNSYVWGSPEALKATGYTLEEFTKLSNLDLLPKGDDKDAYRRKVLEFMGKKHGTTPLTFETKSGQIKRGTVEYHVFEYDGGYYMAAKGINMEPA